MTTGHVSAMSENMHQRFSDVAGGSLVVQVCKPTLVVSSRLLGIKLQIKVLTAHSSALCEYHNAQ